MKKALTLLLALSLLALFTSGCCHPDKVPVSSDESGAETTDKKDPPAEPNPASDFVYAVSSQTKGIRIEKYIGSSEHVIIPSYIDNLPVLALRGVPAGDWAVSEGVFQGTNVKTVFIPDTVKTVGFRCFKDCEELTSVTFAPDSSLNIMGGSAFENCTKIEEIDLSSTSLREIDNLAFHGCVNLKSIVFSDTLEKIGDSAFYECSALSEINFPESLLKIGSAAFAYCTSLKQLEIPTNVDLMCKNEAIFHNVPTITKFIFRDGRETIKGYAFILTGTDVEIVVPASVKVLSPRVFYLYFPKHITFTFMGDAPEIIEDFPEDDELGDWVRITTIRYNPNTSGWDSFAWKDRCEEMQPFTQN